MKTYVCDFCGDFLDDRVKCVEMREIKKGGFLSKKQKIHICKNCWFEIVKKSREKRSEQNER